MDLIQMTIDYKSTDEIPEDKKFEHLRYVMNQSNFSVSARIGHSAVAYKRCCGRGGYDIAALKEICKADYEVFDVYIDGK